MSDYDKAFEKGADLAEHLIGRIGYELSAPINFCVSRPYFRYMMDMTVEEMGAFSSGYRLTWAFNEYGARNEELK